MRKALPILLSSLLILTALVIPAAADSNLDVETPWVDIEELAPDASDGIFGDSYPYSVDYDWPEVKGDPIITGVVITGVNPADGVTHCWSNGTDNAAKAFDGDVGTFFDPYEASMFSWAGLRLDQAYELTEVRICSRSGFDDRIRGAAIQGSNDNGATWHNVVYFDPEVVPSGGLLTNDYHIVTPEKNDDYVAAYQESFDMDDASADFSRFWVGHGSYSMYRYVNFGTSHGDCAEIELYGHPADAYVGDEREIAQAEKSDLESFVGTIDYIGTQNDTSDGAVSGKVIGGGGSYSAGSNEYADAWDNNGETFYDPASAGPDCWTGLLADQATVVTEVRVRPRIGWYSRTPGAHVQGSNNGVNWVDLAEYTAEDALAEDAEQTYIVKPVEGAAAYWMFRYVSDGVNHGDVGDIVLIGTAGEATLEYEVPSAPAVDMLKCDGNEYDEAAAAAKALGTKPIVNYEFVEGATVHFNNEGPENLWDDDVTTKFCTDGFPAWSVAQTEEKYSINAIVMATANDNSSNPGRAPGSWTIYGSNDNQGWDVIAAGDDTFFTEVSGDVDFTFFGAKIEPTAAYSYFKFECTGTPINLMQVSEVVLCSADAPEAAAPAEPEPEPAKEETPTVEEVVEDAAENAAEAAGEVAEAVENTVENAANAVSEAANNVAETAKSGCGSMIGGGLIVLVTVLGSAWISRRK